MPSESLLKLAEGIIADCGPIGVEELFDAISDAYRRADMPLDIADLFETPEELFRQGRISRRKDRWQYMEGPPVHVYSIKRRPVPESVQPRLF